HDPDVNAAPVRRDAGQAAPADAANGAALSPWSGSPDARATRIAASRPGTIQHTDERTKRQEARHQQEAGVNRSEFVYLGSSKERLPHSAFGLVTSQSAGAACRSGGWIRCPRARGVR